ncbi:MAG: TrmO family methyltransferase [Spirochaetales bacterium]|nr:TrmO family methyltransferase [Spirochaetales bacterium]
MELKQIGVVEQKGDFFAVRLEQKFIDGLKGLDGFSMLNILWWADQTIDYYSDESILIKKPYTKGPEQIGVFATRSPIRPNAICVSPIGVKAIDYNEGIIETYYIDAFPGTPVIDIKPYHPSTEISKEVEVPTWCRHWPESIEDSGRFDWESEFNF